MITNNVPNAFNTPRLCMITGDIKPLGQLKATPRETQLFAKTTAQREKIVMAETANQIHITSQEASDRSKRVAGRHLRG